MVRQKIGTTLASCGIVMLMFGAGTLPAQGAEPMHVALQPSPRPALDPAQRSGGSSASSGSSLETGHITGTVIDLRTGAPAAGITVKVGGDFVTTDSNGNYDHWLTVGSYAVALALSSGQGEPAQGSATVAVEPGASTIQHLNFLSPAPVASAATAVQAAAPTALANAPAPKPAVQPKRLPRTGSDGSSAWLWLSFGMLLVLAGGMIGFGPMVHGKSAARLIRAHAANASLLQSLLARPIRSRPAAVASDDLLAALFEHESRATGAPKQR